MIDQDLERTLRNLKVLVRRLEVVTGKVSLGWKSAISVPPPPDPSPSELACVEIMQPDQLKAELIRLVSALFPTR